jgi:anaerobic magnesium-protoporphyrin IX monomethyl ester cyclase
VKIALVLPQYSVSLHDPCCFPLGFMTISAVLKQAGHNVKILNFNLQEYELEDELVGMDAALFTGFQEFTEFNKIVASWCKEQGVHTVLGGAMATFKPEEMIQHFDTVIVGEGEEVIELALHSHGIVQGTKPNLGTVPSPDYEGFGIDRYNELHGTKYMGVLTSRGCPYRCKFCVQTCSFQFRKLASVFEEIDCYVATYGVTHIVFNDNTLNLVKDRWIELCEGMGERKLTWSAAIRVDRFDEEMAAAAKAGGCNYLVVGIESFNDNKLAAMDKKITSAQIILALDVIHKYKIGYHGNILLGLPGETYEDILSELECLPTQYNVFPVLVQPFVGTSYQDRDISAEQATYLSETFRVYAESKGMNMYREAA